MPLDPSWRAVSNPIPLLAPVIRAILVVMVATLGRLRQGRERPAEPGTGDTTRPARAGGKLGCCDRGEPRRAGGVPAGQAGPDVPAGRRAARGGAAAHAGAAPPGGRPAGQDVRRLLHPAGARPQPVAVAAGAVRAGPGTAADRRPAGLLVPDG